VTDARLPGRWASSLDMDSLSDASWRVFSYALMWSAENGTDGFIPTRYLKRLHPDGEQPEAFEQLAHQGLWVRGDAGYQLKDWDTSLGQSTREQVETYRAKGRERTRKYRAKRTTDDADVTRDVTGDVRANVGKGKGRGLGTDYDEENEAVNTSTGEVSWPEVASIPAGSAGDVGSDDWVRRAAEEPF
jgi:hypothetical protein